MNVVQLDAHRQTLGGSTIAAAAGETTTTKGHRAMDRDAEHREMQHLSARSDGEASPRPRMPLARVVELLLTRTPRATQEAVEITRNAKGDYQYNVNAVAQEGETLEDCCIRAQAIADKLAEAYALSRAQLVAQQGDKLIESARKAVKEGRA